MPAVVSTDEVIPVHLFDDSSATRGIVLVWTFQFDDVLDPDKLHSALSQLFEMDGWRRFSGRFRYRVSNLQHELKLRCLVIRCLPLLHANRDCSRMAI